MKKIILIRHAESEANLQVIVPKHGNTIKITEKGHKQAHELAEKLSKPDRIFVSRYIRTIETATPLIKKYPEASVHLWLDVHEFDPLDPLVIVDDFNDFKKFVEHYDKYFLELDPHKKHEGTTESFKEFVNRIHGAILKMKNIPDGVNYIFTHGWCIKLFTTLLNSFSDFDNHKEEPDIYKKVMEEFWNVYDKKFKTENTGQYDITDLVEKYRG